MNVTNVSIINAVFEENFCGNLLNFSYSSAKVLFFLRNISIIRNHFENDAFYIMGTGANSIDFILDSFEFSQNYLNNNGLEISNFIEGSLVFLNNFTFRDNDGGTKKNKIQINLKLNLNRRDKSK